MQRQKYRVTMVDDTVYEVVITNRSEVAFEREAHMRQWPKDSEFIAMTYKAWWQLVKIDKTITCTYDDFEQNLCDEVAPFVTTDQIDAIPPAVRAEALKQLRADGLLIEPEAVAVDPTRPTLQHVSALP